MRPDLVRDREIHNDDRTSEDEVEVSSHPGGIMNHRVHPVAHIDEAAEAAEAKHHKGEPDSQHHGTLPWQRRDPTKHATPAAEPARDLERGGYGEDRQQGRYGNEGGE